MTGCQCSLCYGLAEYMRDLTGREYGLKPAPGHGPVQACDGSMTCVCESCARDRVRQLHQRTVPQPRQPWETRPARLAA